MIKLYVLYMGYNFRRDVTPCNISSIKQLQNGDLSIRVKIYISVISWDLGLVRLLGRSPFVLNFGAGIFWPKFLGQKLGQT